MTTLPPFDYELAPDLQAALAAVAGGATLINGGTELLPAMSMGLLAPERVVSIRAVSELQTSAVKEGRLVLGAGLTHRDITRDRLVHEHAGLLAEACDGVGNVRVRSTGTIGGNLAFAEPRSDVITALLALDARVRLLSLDGQREKPLRSFVLGPYEVGLKPGELIASVTIPTAQADFGVYRKIVRSERPIVGAALVHLPGNGWRLAVGAVGMTSTVVETSTLGEIDPVAIATDIDTTADLSGSEAYKRHLTKITIERCRRAAADFAGEESSGE